MTPTGSNPEAVKAYYDWLLQHHINSIPTNRATEILGSGPFWIFFWAFVLIAFFFLYSLYLQNVHREKGELYGAASFAGSILERIGPLSFFTWIISAVILFWGLYFIVIQASQGQIY